MKKHLSLGILAILLILLITIGISYAYFTANLTGIEDSTTITVTGGSMNIDYNGGEDITVNNIIPSNKAFAIKTFTVTGNNTTDVEMGYKLELVITNNTFTSDALKYKLLSINTDNNGLTAPSSTELSNIDTGESRINLGIGYFESPTTGNKVHTYNLEIYFPNQDYNQNIDQNKQISAYIAIKNHELLFDYIKGVNKPVLFAGMTPIKWDQNNNEIKTSKYDPKWYDYDNKKWANAKSEDGSYWVWVPRYAYKITSGYHSTTTGTIDIKFLKEDTIDALDSTNIEREGYVTGVKDTSMHYFLHPTFETVGSELGFWVAKYESTAAEGVSSGASSCESADDVSTKTIKVVPNATSWRCITNSNAFDAVKNMKTNPVYGWEPAEVDPHIMTNLEWGSVTYLSKSSYGANTEKIWNNAYNEYRTGCSGTGVNAKNESTCVIYNTENGVKASTTHNIYGVYDMSGGSWDRVSGYVNNDHTNLSTYGSSILNADQKYKNVYGVGVPDNRGANYVINQNIYGDAVYETSNTGNAMAGSWFGNYSYMPQTTSPWFFRGGRWNSTTTSAGPFAFQDSTGAAAATYSFRVVVSLQK